MMKKLMTLICCVMFGFFAACGDKQSAKGDTDGLTLVRQSEEGVLYFDVDNASCAKAAGISGGFQEGVAEKYGVAVSAIKFLRTQTDGKDCSVVVDTPKGPKQCFAGSVIKNKSGQFLFHTYAKGKDGSETVIRGACL
jgi:hypothetical protein